MKSNVLRGPLIKAAIVLLILSLLVFFTSTSPDGNVWASMGSIVVVILRTIQWLIGLSISLVVCLAVMFGIFLGAVSLVNPSTASRMYEGLRTNIITLLAPVLALFSSDKEEQLAATLEQFGTDLKKELTGDLQRVQAGLSKAQDELGSTLSSITRNLTSLTETVATLPATEQLEAIGEEIKETVATVASVQGNVDTLKASVEKTGKQVQEISPESVLGDLPSRIETLEQQETPEPVAVVDISPLEKTIASLQDKLAAVEKKADEALQAAAKQPVASQPEKQKAAAKQQAPAQQSSDDEHRIFSYFDDPADKKKVAELAASTLKKDLSYKQAMEFIAKGLGGAKGKIITSHPSLSKDYLRQCRKNA